MAIIYGDDERVAAFVARELGLPAMGRMTSPFVRPFVALGIERGGEIIGGLVFTSYTGPDIELTVAGHGCWTRGVIKTAARYVFDQLGCQRMTITLRDEAHVPLAERIGFKTEGRSPDKFGPGRAGVIMGLLASDCRWN